MLVHNFFRNEKHVFISGLWKIFTRSPFLSTPEKYWKYVVLMFPSKLPTYVPTFQTISISPLQYPEKNFFSVL